MKIRLMLAATATLISSSAFAGLEGSALDMELTQTGLVGGLAGPSGGVHTYGLAQTFALPTAATSWHVLDHGIHEAYDNSFFLDFTDFDYAAFALLAPAESWLSVGSVTESIAPDGPFVFLTSDLDTDISAASVTYESGFDVSWDIGAVIGADPVGPGVIIAWNSVPVPAPGAMAALGLAGLIASRRRRP